MNIRKPAEVAEQSKQHAISQLIVATEGPMFESRSGLR